MEPMNEDDQWMHSELRATLNEIGVVYGRWLAEFAETGSVIAITNATKCGKCRYTITIATNDAADHLIEWSDEQIQGRRKAAEKAGQTMIDYHGKHRPSDS